MKNKKKTKIKKKYNEPRRIVTGKRIAVTVATVLATLAVLLAGAFSFAYFSKKDIYDAYMGGNVQLLFERLTIDQDTPSNGSLYQYQLYLYNQTLETPVSELPAGEYDPEAERGTEKNPYIISDIKHLYNLSELQNIGFFEKEYISKNTYDASGKYTGGKVIPYFRVCDEDDGKPITILGDDKISIETIGTEALPFIGSIKGAFTEGTCIVENKTSEVSAIHDVKIICSDSRDIGLFGHISYLGDDTGVKDGDPFPGVASEITDLLLSDIQVSAKNPTWNPTDVLDHLFSYKGKTEGSVPKETHHIGIGFGHIEYVKLKNISVYYSADNILAIDVSDKAEANYMSTTGIVGFLYNMNPKVKGANLIKGSGVQNDEIVSGTLNEGSTIPGGGLLSGTEKGYVWAKGVYDKFHWIGKPAVEDANVTEDTTGTINIMNAHDQNGDPLCREEQRIDIMANDGYSGTGRYYFYDGVFTFALSEDQKDTITNTWADPNNPDQFKVGAADGTWNATSTGGDSSVLAFLKQLTNDADFYNAASKTGQKFVVSHDISNLLFLMTLNTKSTGDDSAATPDVAFYTPGNELSFYQNSLMSNLITDYQAGKWSPIKAGVDVDANFGANLATLTTDNPAYKVLDLGTAATAAALKDTYSVTVTPAPDSAQDLYFYYNTATIANLNVSSMTIPKIEKYKGDGYFYFTTGTEMFSGTFFQLNWRSFDGSTIDTNITKVYVSSVEAAIYKCITYTHSSANPNQLQTSTATWGTESIFQTKISGRVGPVLDIERGIIYKYNGSAVEPSDNPLLSVDGKYATYGTPVNCYVRDPLTNMVTVNENKYLFSQFDGDSTATSDEERTYTLEGIITEPAFIVDKAPLYQFKSANGQNIMQLLTAYYTPTYPLGSTPLDPIDYKLLWNGPIGSYVATDFALPTNFGGGSEGGELPKIDQNNYIQYGAVRFVRTVDENDNESIDCYIVYSDGTVSRFVTYNSTGGGRFTAATALDDDSRAASVIQLYTIEATKDAVTGVGAIEPETPFNPDGTNNALSANQYVLFAQSSQNSLSNTYALTDVTTLGWKLVNSNESSQINLSKKFQMTGQIEPGESFDLWGVTSSTTNLVRAPVGSNGVEANIPQSCIAFRMNSSGAKKIQVIVAIPTSRLFPGQSGGEGELPASAVCYFNLWHFPAAGWEQGVTQTFDPAVTLDKFQIPISRPTNPSLSANDNDYVNVTYNDITYRCYLNGNQVLIAYEFTVNEEGIYLLGATGFDTANNNARLDVPTQIVYFAADAVSSGDGELPEPEEETNESRMGTIDFVYDNGTKILLVSEKSTVVGGMKDYSQYFFPTYSILYFDNNERSGNAFVNINEATVHIRRVQNNGTSATLRRYLAPPDRIKINAYSPNSDGAADIPLSTS